MSRQTKAKARQRHNRRVMNMRKNNGADGLFTTGEMRAGLHLKRHAQLVEQRKRAARAAQ